MKEIDELVEKVALDICGNGIQWDECIGSGNDPVYCNGNNFKTAKQILFGNNLAIIVEKELPSIFDCDDVAIPALRWKQKILDAGFTHSIIKLEE